MAIGVSKPERRRARRSSPDDVGTTVRALCGRLSSQGHAQRRVRRPKCPERYISGFLETGMSWFFRACG